MMTNKCGLTMSPTAISVAVRDEIQRFESVHPSIYAIHELIDEIDIPNIQQQLRDYIISIEDAFVNSQEWTLSRSVQDFKLGIVGTFNSGKSPLVHHFLTGSYLNEETFEGGRFKKEMVIDGRSYLLLIREEGGPPDIQFSQWVDAVIFVYNVTNETSFNTIYTYYSKMGISRRMIDVPIFLVASRDGVTDSNPRIISEARGTKMAADLKNCQYLEVCSEYGFNVNLVFQEACEKILASRLPPTSSTTSLSSSSQPIPMSSLHRGTHRDYHTQLSSPTNISASTLSVSSSYSSHHNNVNNNNINNNNNTLGNDNEDSWSTCNNTSRQHHHHQLVNNANNYHNNPGNKQQFSTNTNNKILNNNNNNLNNINNNNIVNSSSNGLNNNNNNSVINSLNNINTNNIPVMELNRHSKKLNMDRRGIIVPLENGGCLDMTTSLHTKLPHNTEQHYHHHHQPVCASLSSKASLNHSVQNPNFVSVSPQNDRKYDNFAKNSFKSSSFHESNLQRRGSQLSLQIDLRHLPSSRHKKEKRSIAERIDSFLKEFPMSKDRLGNKTTTSSNIFNNFSNRHRSYSIQSIEQGDDEVSKDFVATPNTTPTPGRKNNRRRSNIFTSKKDCEDKKLKNGDAKLGSGRVIPIKQGWLYKKSSKPLSREWQKKYVTLLDDGRLTYHSSLHDYMENIHGKEIKLGQTTVKIPGQGPRGSEVTRMNSNNIMSTHVSRQTEANNNNFMSPACRDGSNSNMSDSIVISNSGVLNNGSTTQPPSISTSTVTIPPMKLETPIAKKKHRRIKSNSRNLDGSDSSDYGYEFIIVSLDNKQWLFEACSLEEREEWITAVEQQILCSLQLNRSSKSQMASHANITVIHTVRNVPGNNECADCGTPNPEWASLNLGALICIECSGIHRNLGTHLSRVRSLELDEWPPNLVEVMTSIGNDLLNSVYEANAIGCKKPNQSSPREEKDKWIRMKYELKNYLPPLPFDGVPIQQQLMDAVACNNVHNLILVLAYCSPADVNTPYNNNTDTRTALHIAAAFGKIVLVQLLLWYGANPDLLDHENHTPAFYAREHKAFECLKILEMITSQ